MCVFTCIWKNYLNLLYITYFLKNVKGNLDVEHNILFRHFFIGRQLCLVLAYQ